MHERHDTLVGDSYEIMPFRDLPKPYQMAIAWYMAVDGEAWLDVDFIGNEEPPPRPSESTPHDEWTKLPEDKWRALENEWHDNWRARLKELLEAAMPEFVRVYGDVPFGVATVTTEAMKVSVMADDEIGQDFECWETYHRRYAEASGLPEHGRTDRWPCIMSCFEDETLQDGWHRFHSYCMAGDADIPVVFYPAQRHLDAKMAVPGIR